MACCKCEEYNWEDPQPAVYTDPKEGKEYCLFHAPSEHKGMDVDTFNVQVSERIKAAKIRAKEEDVTCSFRGTIFPGNITISLSNDSPAIDFGDAVFEADVSVYSNSSSGDGYIMRYTLGGSILFEGARFKGKANFGRVHFAKVVVFKSARFEGEAVFKDSIFKKELDISQAQFKGKALFSGCHYEEHVSFAASSFGKVANFNEAVFEEDVLWDFSVFKEGASYDHAVFKSRTKFRRMAFTKAVYFRGARFLEYTFFIGLTCDGEVSFKEAIFEKGMCFEEGIFRRTVDFILAQFSGYIFFSNVDFKGGATYISSRFDGPVEFAIKPLSGNPIIFSNCTISQSAIAFKGCNLKHISFIEQRDLSNIHFVNSFWTEAGRVKVYTEDEEENLQLTRDFYQRMKAKYKAENNEYEASKWHVAEKEAQLKLLSRDGESSFLRDTLWLYKWTSGFGENPRQAFWVLLVFLIFPLIVLAGSEVWHHFVWWDFDSSKVNSILKEWLKFIPLTRAISREEPGAVHAIMIIWQLLISVQAALFAFALRNRFRR